MLIQIKFKIKCKVIFMYKNNNRIILKLIMYYMGSNSSRILIFYQTNNKIIKISKGRVKEYKGINKIKILYKINLINKRMQVMNFQDNII